MTEEAPCLSLLEELDARQDELLAELDRLNHRIEQALQEGLARRQDLSLSGIAEAAQALFRGARDSDYMSS